MINDQTEGTNRLHSAHESAPVGQSGDNYFVRYNGAHTPSTLGFLVQSPELCIGIFP